VSGGGLGQVCERTFGADAHLVLRAVLQETLDTTAWELGWEDMSAKIPRERCVIAKFEARSQASATQDACNS